MMEKLEILLRDCGDYWKAEIRTYTRLDPIRTSGVGLDMEEAVNNAKQNLELLDTHLRERRATLER
jgi:hypothetical protein